MLLTYALALIYKLPIDLRIWKRPDADLSLSYMQILKKMPRNENLQISKSSY